MGIIHNLIYRIMLQEFREMRKCGIGSMMSGHTYLCLLPISKKMAILDKFLPREFTVDWRKFKKTYRVLHIMQDQLANPIDELIDGEFCQLITWFNDDDARNQFLINCIKL